MRKKTITQIILIIFLIAFSYFVFKKYYIKSETNSELNKKDDKVSKNEFQKNDKNLIKDARFPVSYEGGTHGMYIMVLISGGLTFEGEQYIDGSHRDFLENTMKNQTININAPSAIQIGNNNSQQLNVTIQSLIEKIDSSNCSRQEKQEAKTLLQEFLKHPLVTTIIGASIGKL